MKFFASDEMKGRNAPSPELKIAGIYIATRIESFGLKPILPDGSFFQKIFIDNIGISRPDAEFEVISENTIESLEYLTDFVVAPRYAGEYEGNAALVGLGVSAPKLGWDDLKDIDLSGKIAIILDAKLPEDHFLKTDRSYIRSRLTRLFSKRAKGAITVIHPSVYKKMKAENRTFEDEPVESIMGNLRSVPFFSGRVTPKAAAILLGINETELLSMFERLDSGEQITSEIYTDRTIKINVKTEQTRSENYTSNIVGYLEGTDPVLKDEYVGFGAHYDHTGVNNNGEIFNGADDNASGTSTLLEVAEAFSKDRPKRSVLFIWHTAEEKGLLGSKYFSDNSPVMHEKISAVFNLDMVGRLVGDSLYIVGSDFLSSELHKINEDMNNKYTKMMMGYSHNTKDDPERWYYRSDQYMYARYGIPVVFYTGPDHEDYHRVTDTEEKINYENMVKIAKLTYYAGREIANRDELLKLDMDPEFTSRGKHNIKK